MNHYSFPGFPIFLKKAAAELRCPEAERPAHRNTTLTAMANLCAQVGAARSADVTSIIEKALEFRDQLHVAARAGDLMLEEVRGAFQDERSTDLPKSKVVSHPRKTRK